MSCLSISLKIHRGCPVTYPDRALVPPELSSAVQGALGKVAVFSAFPDGLHHECSDDFDKIPVFPNEPIILS